MGNKKDNTITITQFAVILLGSMIGIEILPLPNDVMKAVNILSIFMEVLYK